MSWVVHTPGNCRRRMPLRRCHAVDWSVPGRLLIMRSLSLSTPTIEWELLRNKHFHTGRGSSSRRHSTNDMLSPIDYEHIYTQPKNATPDTQPDHERVA